MNVVECPGLILLSKVANHDQIKSVLLDQISQMGVFGMRTNQECLYSTDYLLPKEWPRPYIKTVLPILKNHNQQVKVSLDSPDHGYMSIHNIWYHQYQTGDWHNWHSHPDCNLSNVYFVSLDQDNPKTTFKHLGKEFQVDVEEGMIITFPSHMLHCSPPNQSPNMKTVIAFNSQLDF